MKFNEQQYAKVLSKNVWAVVGATPNRDKFGNKVFRHLLDNGYTVYPIHPSADNVEGHKAYKSLQDLPETPQVVNFVVPPHVTNSILPELKERGIKYAWAQPGASNAESETLAQELGIKLSQEACVLVMVPWVDE